MFMYVLAYAYLYTSIHTHISNVKSYFTNCRGILASISHLILPSKLQDQSDKRSMSVYLSTQFCMSVEISELILDKPASHLH